MKQFLIAILLFLFSSVSYTQEHQQLLENLIEITAENSEEEIDINELIETWETLLNYPININQAETDDFSSLLFLNDFQVKNIIQYRKQNGTIYSIYELAQIEGLDKSSIQNLQPFIRFEESGKQLKSLGKPRCELIMRNTRTLERSQGYLEKTYHGAPEKYYLRFKRTSSKINFGFTTEKDPGEPFFSGENKTGFDFYSFYSNCRISKHKLFIGDYHLRAGQGLVIWQGFASGKSPEVNQVYKSNQGIRSYSSTDENRFFRGVATELNFKHGQMVLFYSAKKIDANIEISGEEKHATSFQTSGLHRTTGEIEDKNTVRENVTGWLFSYAHKNFKLGFTATFTKFDHELKLKEQPSNKFLFQGNEIYNYGLNYKYSFKKIFLFGEVASGSSNGIALLNGALLHPADNLELSVVYRNFAKRYNTMYGQTISEYSKTNDEKGLYIGAKLLPFPNISISAFHDFFSSRWIKHQTVAPPNGNETYFQIKYTPSDALNFYVRYFSEKKDQQIKSFGLKFNKTQETKRLRFNLDIQVNEIIALKSRAECSFFRHENKEQGLLLFQDIKYTSQKIPLNFQLRFAWFDTDGYSSRIYAYENDLLYNYSVPALHGQGTRIYVNGKYKIGKQTEIWLKLSRTQFYNQQSIGSGLAMITGDRKTDIKLQFRYRF